MSPASSADTSTRLNVAGSMGTARFLGGRSLAAGRRYVAGAWWTHQREIGEMRPSDLEVYRPAVECARDYPAPAGAQQPKSIRVVAARHDVDDRVISRRYGPTRVADQVPALPVHDEVGAGARCPR